MTTFVAFLIFFSTARCTRCIVCDHLIIHEIDSTRWNYVMWLRFLIVFNHFKIQFLLFAHSIDFSSDQQIWTVQRPPKFKLRKKPKITMIVRIYMFCCIPLLNYTTKTFINSTAWCLLNSKWDIFLFSVTVNTSLNVTMPTKR